MHTIRTRRLVQDGLFWIESELVDEVGTKKGCSWDRKWTYAIISAFCQKYIPISRRVLSPYSSYLLSSLHVSFLLPISPLPPLPIMPSSHDNHDNTGAARPHLLTEVPQVGPLVRYLRETSADFSVGLSLVPPFRL